MAKRNSDLGKPRRIEITCPNCGKVYTLMPSEARKVEKGTNGRRGCCSMACAAHYRYHKKDPEGVFDAL